MLMLFFFFQAEDGIRDRNVTGVQTCALPILNGCTIPGSGYASVLPSTNRQIVPRMPTRRVPSVSSPRPRMPFWSASAVQSRSEEHTSELQSRFDLVCRLLLEKKNKKI